MKKNMSIIGHISQCDYATYAGKRCVRKTDEQVTFKSFEPFKMWLKEVLDVMVRPDGEPYSPSKEDVASACIYKFIKSEEAELRKRTKRYRAAYKGYKSIIDKVASSLADRSECNIVEMKVNDVVVQVMT